MSIACPGRSLASTISDIFAFGGRVYQASRSDLKYMTCMDVLYLEGREVWLLALRDPLQHARRNKVILVQLIRVSAPSWRTRLASACDVELEHERILVRGVFARYKNTPSVSPSPFSRD